jgi:hypothetical protein
MNIGIQRARQHPRLSIWERIDRWIKRLVTGRRDV